jgi:XRE family transcriptional regulator, master regulator for biofilm formation
MLGDKVRRKRVEKNLSITKFAKKTGIAKSYLSSIERNIKTNPSIQILERMAEVLGIPVSYLLTNTSGDTVDDDWDNLIKKAIELGVTKEEFKAYLNYKEH